MKRALAFTLMVLSIMIIAVSCEEPQAHVHTYSEKWECDENYHWHKATCEHTDEKGDKAKHTWGNWVVDEKATETKEGSRHHVCTVCNYEAKETIPVVGHVHTPSSSYKSDDEGHWQLCSGCGNKLSYSSHSLEYESTGDLYHLQRCTVCDYKTAEEKHSIATTTHSDGKKEQFCEVCNKYTKTLAAVATETKTVTAVEKATDLDAGGDTYITVVDNQGNVSTNKVNNSQIVKNSETVTISAEIVATADTSSSSTTTTGEEKETTVSFPAGALKMVENATEVKLTITALTAEEATASDSGYQGEKTGTTTNENKETTVVVSTTEAVVAGIEFKLSGADSSSLSVKKTGSAGGTTETGTTVTTYIAAGLCDSFDTTKGGTAKGIEVKYIGTNSGTKPTVVSYDADTGKLVFTVYHFSKYAIIATDIVATDSAGKMYSSLKNAVSGVTANGTITLLKDVDLTPKSNNAENSVTASTIEVEKSLTLNLNGKTLKSNARVFLVHKDTLTIKGGTIETSEDLKNNSSAIRIDCEKGDAGVVLSSDAILKAKNSYGIVAFGEKNKATIDVYGTIESANPCIAGNGSKDYFGCDVTMNVYDGSKLTQDKSYTTKADSWTSDKDYVAIYQPNIGTLKIYGGTITSKNGSAVEIRAGVANISGGTLGSEAEYKTKYNNNGPSVTGAAVAVSQHTSALSQKEREIKITVTINGGTFSATGTNGKQLAVVDTLNLDGNTGSSVENTKLVKAVVKSGVNMKSDNIVGTRFGSSDGIDGNYYVDAASGAKAGEARIHISNLAELLPEGNKNAFNSNSDSTTAIVIDGKNAYIVDEWQDLWFGGNVTIKNVEFAKGISLTARTTSEMTVTIEGCTIYYCNQTELLKKVDADNNFRIDNSGNGLCLNIDAPNEQVKKKEENGNEVVEVDWPSVRKGKITVNISNCTLIGDGNDDAVRNNSWPTTKEYIENKDNSSYENYKGRGNGIGLGVASGNGNFLKKAAINYCTFRNLRNAALQIYDHFTAMVTVACCDFQGWGLNAGKTGETDNKASAIRGLVDTGSEAQIEIKDCTFNSTLVTTKNMKCEIDNLLKDTDTPTKWTQSGDKWSANATASGV